MTSDADVRPFRIEFPDADPIDMRRRVSKTRWPERETVTGDSQGVPPALMQDLARYWVGGYDWRRCEATLNALPRFMTEIDGLDFHFIHVRSACDDALPLIVTHGWPGSIIEQLKIIDPLPAAVTQAMGIQSAPEVAAFYATHMAYAQIMSTRPQTPYGLADSPVDPAAFMIDHGDGTGQPGLVAKALTATLDSPLTRDDILDNITLYWLTNTGVSAARLYWENKADFSDAKPITLPNAYSLAPHA
jgi:Epoxide hydrolase N terminus